MRAALLCVAMIVMLLFYARQSWASTQLIIFVFCKKFQHFILENWELQCGIVERLCAGARNEIFLWADSTFQAWTILATREIFNKSIWKFILSLSILVLLKLSIAHKIFLLILKIFLLKVLDLFHRKFGDSIDFLNQFLLRVVVQASRYVVVGQIDLHVIGK